MRTLLSIFLSKFLAVLCALSILAIGCRNKGLEGFSDKPSYLSIKDIEVTSQEEKFGEGTDAITDAWVFVDDQQIGVFELPCDVPVLLTGSRNIKIFGGIKQGGINSQRERYEFYEAYEIDTNLTAEKTISLTPQLNYIESTIVPWKEDFEDIASVVDSTIGSKAAVRRTSDPKKVRTGLFSGEVLLTETANEVVIHSVDRIAIPKNVPSYLELDYKSNVSMKLSMNLYLRTGTIIPTDILTIRASDRSDTEEGWKKMYVYLSPGIAASPDAFEYRFYFSAQLPDGASSGYIYLDNLKIVH